MSAVENRPAPAAKEARDFTYIKPQRRRLTEYEALTVHMQPDHTRFDRPNGRIEETEWYLLRGDGSALWNPASTALRHSDWFAYRDPSQHWQRTYVRHQEQQEGSIDRMTDDAALDGSLAELDPRWIRDLLCGHYRAWSFFDYAVFRSLAPAQREALSDTLGNALCFQSFDHLRHAQDVIIYLVELENHSNAVVDGAGKEAWLNSPEYQPARKLAEEIMATRDWAELMIGLNLVVGPLLQQLAVSDLVRRNALSNRDAVAAHIVMTAERDRRRNLAAAQALVGLVVEDSNPDAAANRATIQRWLDDWTRRAAAAAVALGPVFERVPVRFVDHATALAAARTATVKIATDLGFTSPLGAAP
jgi:methane monooxygenase component A beta chain/propane monooxygenase small subunit